MKKLFALLIVAGIGLTVVGCGEAPKKAAPVKPPVADVAKDPKADEPKKDEPKADEPKKDEPKADAPKAEDK